MSASQPIEIFFAGNALEAVALPCVEGREPSAAQVSLGYRLLGGAGVHHEELSRNWGAVVICTAGFAKAHKGKPYAGRPARVSLCFLAPQSE